MKHYETLGVAPDATEAEIRRAYRKLAGQHHPDREGGDKATMQAVNEAYAVLGDPAKRAEYDEVGDLSPVDIAARRTLEAGLEAAITSNAENILAFVQGGVDAVLEELERRMRDAKGRIVRYERRLGKVRYKGRGANVVEVLLKRHIDGARAEIAAAESARAANLQVLKLLDLYENTEPTKPPEVVAALRYAGYEMPGSPSYYSAP